MGASQSKEHPILASDAINDNYSVLIAGSTGACGRAFVCEHLQDPKCSRVIALTRRPIDDLNSMFPRGDHSKLVVKQVDFNNLQSSEVLPIDLTTVAVCALGSAPYSEESDFTVPCHFAKFCKDSGVKTMTMVSSVGVKKGSIFGYLDTLGRREEFFTDIGFERCIILRPKFLLRHELARAKEMVAAILPASKKIDVSDVAKAGLRAMGRRWPGNLLILENADLLSLSQ